MINYENRVIGVSDIDPRNWPAEIKAQVASAIRSLELPGEIPESLLPKNEDGSLKVFVASEMKFDVIAASDGMIVRAVESNTGQWGLADIS